MTTTDRLRSLLAINRAIVAPRAAAGLLSLIAERAALLWRGRACILLLDRSREQLELAAGVGLDADEGFSARLDEHIDGALRELFDCTPAETIQFAPVIAGERILGVLAVCRVGASEPDPDDGMLLAGLADQVALAAIQQAALAERPFGGNVLVTSAVGIFVLDERLVVCDINPRAAELFDRDCEAVRGCFVHDVLDELAGPVIALVHRAVTGEDVVVGEVSRSMSRTGERLAWEIRCVRLPGRAGQPRGVLGIVSDITARVRANEHAVFLSQSSALMGSALDYATTLGQVARLAVPTLADGCTIDLVVDGARRTIASAWAEPTAEPPACFEDGPLTAELAADRVRAPLQIGTRTIGAIALWSLGSGRRFGADDLSCVTELARRASLAIDNARHYQHACAALRVRDDLLAIVSHDLRTPLGTVVMTAASLDRFAEPAAARGLRRDVGRIQRSAEYMARLIDDLTDLALLESGRFALACTIEPVDRMVDDALDMLEPAARAKSLRVDVCVDAAAAVACDRERVLRVLTNLVGNAIKFSPEHETIDVSAQRRGDAVRFTVGDRGPGIDGDDLDNVFLPYWKGRPGAGTGLGLYIARLVVEAHEGAIWVDSTPGQGAAFSFELPASP